jgi:hypothetical protein
MSQIETMESLERMENRIATKQDSFNIATVGFGVVAATEQEASIDIQVWATPGHEVVEEEDRWELGAMLKCAYWRFLGKRATRKRSQEKRTA